MLTQRPRGGQKGCLGMEVLPISKRHQTAIKRTVNRKLLIKWYFRGAGDGNRTRMTSLEGVWRTAVRVAELATPMPVDSRG